MKLCSECGMVLDAYSVCPGNFCGSNKRQGNKIIHRAVTEALVKEKK